MKQAYVEFTVSQWIDVPDETTKAEAVDVAAQVYNTRPATARKVSINNAVTVVFEQDGVTVS